MNQESIKTDLLLVKEYQERAKYIQLMINAYGEDGIELCLNEACVSNLFCKSSEWESFKLIINSIKPNTNDQKNAVRRKSSDLAYITGYELTDSEFEEGYNYRLKHYSFCDNNNNSWIINGDEPIEL